MPKRKIPVQYQLPVKRIPFVHGFGHPAQVALVGSAVVASIYPQLAWLLRRAGVPGLLEPLLVGGVVQFVPSWPRVYAASVAFLSIVLAAKLRWLVIRALLRWHGWIFQMNSLKTKMWALTIKILLGPGPFGTYDLQSILPKEPLPTLNKTLDLWLSVTENLLSPEEYENTKEAVEDFRHNEGPKVQAYLQKRAATHGNWMYEYWLTTAYLSNRESLAMNFNYSNTSVVPPERTTDQLSRAANMVWGFAKYREFVSRQQVQPVLLRGFLPLCMQGYRYLYNAVRVPKEHIDTCEVYPNAKHVIIVRKGQYFKLDCYKRMKNGSEQMYSKQEIYVQLKRICDMADQWETEMGGYPLPIAALTSQQRHIWAKQRLMLADRNQESLETVESAMFILNLSEVAPKNYGEFMKLCQTGTGNDRWFDKCFTSIVYSNTWNGTNVEHSSFDATTFVSPCEYLTVYEEYEDGKLPGVSSIDASQIQHPERLEWNLNGLEKMILTAAQQHRDRSEDFDLVYTHLPYGKRLMKQAGLSPDGYIQMAMQLAFTRLHKHLPKTYEPTTRRLFMMGRTETIHPVSASMLGWLKAMEDPACPRGECVRLLREAVQYQVKYRLNATIGDACDRHLLALMCASREMGMDLPNIFTDKAWTSPFVLSTSQTPLEMYNQNEKEDFMWEGTGGVFGPACHQGYGCCYIVVGEDMVNLTITSWKSCKDTDSARLSQAVVKAMEDMLTLFDLDLPQQ